jgi:hypothetical protein
LLVALLQAVAQQQGFLCYLRYFDMLVLLADGLAVGMRGAAGDAYCAMVAGLR